MEQLIVNFAVKNEKGLESNYFANAFYFSNNQLVKTINNVSVNEEQKARLYEIAANPKKFDVVKELNSITQYVSPLLAIKEKLSEQKKIVEQFQKIDSNYALSVGMTYKGMSVPEPIVEVMFNSKTEKEMLAIHRFHLKCLSNPNPESVKDLFEFINKSKLIITPSGNFVTFRRIVCLQKPTSITLYTKINDTFNQLFLHGKSVDAKEYTVVDGKLHFDTKNQDAKSIREIRDSIASLEGKFTDNHSKKFDFRIGKTYVERNYDANHLHTCSRGLHSGSFDYVQSNSWLGEQMVYCIVNPTKVVAVSDSASKVRSSELYFAGLIDEDFETFKSKLENGVVNFDYEDSAFENDYTGNVIEYNSVSKNHNDEVVIFSEEDYDDVNLDDEDVSEEVEDLDQAYDAGFEFGYAAAEDKYQKQLAAYKAEIQKRLRN